ncbi:MULTISPECIES: DUF1120 domain-containing protein [Klebsiella]|uniref:DUF1120 domain-containing protein n=1 Tax=Klebsiella TaxID=570 RepID=UPI000DA2D3A3|nr:DUF1120 domain-containing protein [Klebsiella oxytoca]MBZ7261254.1 DUF1120 domain-containing protein [Klebsiella oxytoca]MBZ7711788.1 DUF1120 domain-containing protein [Klebsiella oxytoca]CAF2916685.1 hypothetical protein AI2945V1_5222 [Klebsiella oxytoca]CAF2931499.1 hypothetical protein AI2946V1_5220 [Klebsiella oxytoca]CAH5729646.1 hypothetical protein AI2946V1_5220 [Klebsiella oxytoca]
MKKLLIAASLSAALFSSFNASAGNDVTLKVTGSIVPGACVPTLPDGGIVDYGTIRNGQIAPTGTSNALVQLGQKSINLTVTCDTEIAVGITSTDNRHDSRVDLSSKRYIEDLVGGGNTTSTSNGFGLGKAPDDITNIGSYTILADPASATADGTAVDVIRTNDITAETLTWETTPSGAFCPLNGGCNSAKLAISVAKTGTLVPQPFKVLNMPLLVTAAVEDNTVLGTKDTITLDGNATISLVYL